VLLLLLVCGRVEVMREAADLAERCLADGRVRPLQAVASERRGGKDAARTGAYKALLERMLRLRHVELGRRLCLDVERRLVLLLLLLLSLLLLKVLEVGLLAVNALRLEALHVRLLVVTVRTEQVLVQHARLRCCW
jgi:hypothetical protein